MTIKNLKDRSIPDPQNQPTIGVDHAAAILGVSAATLYEAVRLGEFPCLRVRSRILIPTQTLIDMFGTDQAV